MWSWRADWSRHAIFMALCSSNVVNNGVEIRPDGSIVVMWTFGEFLSRVCILTPQPVAKSDSLLFTYLYIVRKQTLVARAMTSMLGRKRKGRASAPVRRMERTGTWPRLRQE